MNEKQFEYVKKDLQEFLVINDKNFIAKNLEMVSFYQKYLDIYLHELQEYKGISIDLDVLKAEKHFFYKFKYDYKLSSLSEIETFIKGDSEIVTLNRRISEQENYLKFLEKALQSIKDIGYVARNMLEYKRIEMGD